MGQGRKKSIRSEKNRCRRRSVSYETETNDSDIMRFIKIRSPIRSGNCAPRAHHYCREATPAPSLFSPARHDSLVDYISTSNLPVKTETTLSVVDISGTLPLISTSPIPSTSPSTGTMNVSDRMNWLNALWVEMNNFYLCIFPNNVIYMNGKGKDISISMKNAILKICVHLHEEGLIRLCEVAYIEKGIPNHFLV